MPESDRWPILVHRHFGQPPRPPVDTEPAPRRLELEWSIGGHFHQSSSVRPARPKPYVSIMREIARPKLHLTRQLEDCRQRSAYELLVDGLHVATIRHRSEIKRPSDTRGHRSTGAQLVVTRNARRRCTTVFLATASRTVSTNSSGVHPLSTETTPS